jgi:hypothetical protein
VKVNHDDWRDAKMTDENKPRAAWEITDLVQWYEIESDILFIEYSAYDALAKENASLRESLKLAVEALGEMISPAILADKALAEIKTKLGDLCGE